MENIKNNYSLDIEKNKKNDEGNISQDEEEDIDDEYDQDEKDINDDDDSDIDDIADNDIADNDIEQQDDNDMENTEQNNDDLNNVNYISENIDYNNNGLDILYDNINLQKIDDELKNNYIENFHSECLNINKDELDKLTKVTRDNDNNIIDEFHKTINIMTKYEKTRILGIRTKQLNNLNIPYVSIDEGLNNNYLIALKELNEKRLPFIIKRPMPNNKFEYWKLQDLEIF